ncbi:MAG: hypothetical protein NZ700_11585 [Gemmataceae bacterium]|nr:hypothetical protein [Gemmataceae bacterium]MDW8265601.1 hypothetical protein [Gemmataceae bacterium]
MPDRAIVLTFCRLAVLGGLVFVERSAAADPHEPLLSAPRPQRLLSLPEAIAYALAHQPALAAQRASLASSRSSHQAALRTRVPTFLAPDLPYRRQQAAVSVRLAQAGLAQAEWDAVYAVTRTHFSVIYARMQRRIGERLVQQLRQRQKEETEELLKRQPGAERSTVRSAILLQLVESQLQDAVAGEHRALAAWREALGAPPDFDAEPAGDELPDPILDLDREQVVQFALERRGEVIQAAGAVELTELEVCAQQALRRLQTTTFAAYADLHARPVRPGSFGRDYSPVAVALEMPSQLSGKREDRVAKVLALQERAEAVAAKTRNLVLLEAEHAFSQYQEYRQKRVTLRRAGEAAVNLTRLLWKDYRQLLTIARFDEAVLAELIAGEVRLQVNEAQFQYVLALAALQRVTAGGILPCWEAALPTGNPAPGDP